MVGGRALLRSVRKLAPSMACLSVLRRVGDAARLDLGLVGLGLERGERTLAVGHRLRHHRAEQQQRQRGQGQVHLEPEARAWRATLARQQVEAQARAGRIDAIHRFQRHAGGLQGRQLGIDRRARHQREIGHQLP